LSSLSSSLSSSCFLAFGFLVRLGGFEGLEGVLEGDAVSDVLGRLENAVGGVDGMTLRERDGVTLGEEDGSNDGFTDASKDDTKEGTLEATLEDAIEGASDGSSDGTEVG
jgi:hypothetical protein